MSFQESKDHKSLFKNGFLKAEVKEEIRRRVKIFREKYAEIYPNGDLEPERSNTRTDRKRLIYYS